MPTISIFILTCVLIVAYAQPQSRQRGPGGQGPPGQGGPPGQAGINYPGRGAGGVGPQFSTGPGVGPGQGLGRGYGQRSGGGEGGGMGNIPLWLFLQDAGNMGSAFALSSLFGGSGGLGNMFGGSQGGGGRGGAGGLFNTPMGYMAATTMGDNMRTMATCGMMNLPPLYCLMGQNM